MTFKGLRLCDFFGLAILNGNTTLENVVNNQVHLKMELTDLKNTQDQDLNDKEITLTTYNILKSLD